MDINDRIKSKYKFVSLIIENSFQLLVRKFSAIYMGGLGW